MSKHSRFFRVLSLAILVIPLISALPAVALQTAPLPDQAAPGYHPGLFTRAGTGLESIPPVVNIYVGGEDGSTGGHPMISYSFIPGNGKTGEGPYITGYISGISGNMSVNITGREEAAEPFRYLATVQSDDNGLFIWTLPDWASDITEVMVGIAR
jgi:hypothetical protein